MKKIAGGNMSPVVKPGIFTTDVSKITAIRNAPDKYISVTNNPAGTLVQVSGLYRNDVLIEAEAMAIIPK